MQADHPTTLLLVEDEAIIALAEQRTLERHGYVVAVAHSGEAAVARVRDNPDVDLILMDIDLGSGIDGTEASRRILELRNLPIVFLTSHTEPDYVDRVKQITGYGYVVKSSGEFVLLESIDMALKLWRAHQQSQQEKERYRLITENMSETVLTVDRDFRVTYVSPSIERLTGFTPAEYRRMPIDEVLTEDSARAVTELGARQAQDPTRESPPMELERRCKDGSTVWTETTSTPIVSEDGEVIGFVATIRDVSERIRYRSIAENNGDVSGRHNMETTFRAVYDQTDESIGVFDEHGTLLQANRAGAAMLGLAPEEVRGRTLSDVYPEPFAGRAMDGIRKVFESGRSRHAEWKTVIDGETKWFLVHLEPNVDPDGTVRSVTTFSTDITGLKRTQEAYGLIAEHASDLVGVLDGELRPIYLSPSAERLFGYRTSDFDGRSIFEVVHEDDVEALKAAIEESIRDRTEEVRREFRILTASGDVVWTDLTATHLYDDRGGLDRIIMTARDITPRVEHNRWLVREVHHRVKNNLAIISSLIFLTEESLPEEVSLANLRNQIEAVRFAHEQLQQASDEQAVEMAPYLQGLLSTVLESCATGAVSLDVEARGVALPGGQAVSVGLIANELATNACKHGFTADAERSFTVVLAVGSGEYVFTASNSGRPFPDDVDPYSVPTLGLRLVVDLAQQLGGGLEVTRGPRPVFTIRFPAPA
ncbi:MAG: PAS domain S-box protein [Spirochaetota bacterium]